MNPSQESKATNPNHPSLRKLMTHSRAIVLLFLPLALTQLAYQAATNAPTSDESAHLAAGLATIRSGDPAFYRVNPPLHRLLSGAAVEIAYCPELPFLYAASDQPSGSRSEFSFAKIFLSKNAGKCRRYFVVGRLVRVPMILLAAFLFVFAIPNRADDIGALSAGLWLTSPLVLGHGWAILPDAMSGCAMAFLLVITMRWLRTRKSFDFVLVGVAWGVALSVKFTFGVLFLAWPVGIILFDRVLRGTDLLGALTLVASHLAHGLIALPLVVSLYGGSDVGLPLNQHGFRSKAFSKLVNCVPIEDRNAEAPLVRVWKQRLCAAIGEIPSPLPKQYLIGVDEQKLDFEKGYPTYFLGERYPDGMWWYYFAGLAAKEQVALWVAMAFAIPGFVMAFMPRGGLCNENAGTACTQRGNIAKETQAKATLVLCFYICFVLFGVLSLNCQMALNVRYALIALPPLFLSAATGIGILTSGSSKWFHRISCFVLAIAFIEVAFVSPHFFSYTNPILGGSYRVPTVLHDSNFDGGQDLWRLEEWLDKHPVAAGCRRFVCLYTTVPDDALGFSLDLPSRFDVEGLIRERNGIPVAVNPVLAGHKPEPDYSVEIVVMRSLGAPAPWTQLSGLGGARLADRLKDLLQYEPDLFVTPTIAVYRGL